MSRTLTAALLLICTCEGMGSIALDASLKDLACGADYVLVGRVIGVDMINQRAWQIRDEKTMNGPSLKNRIRLFIAVDEVLSTTAGQVPSQLKVPLDSFMHYSLGDVKSAHREPYRVSISYPAILPFGYFAG